MPGCWTCSWYPYARQRGQGSQFACLSKAPQNSPIAARLLGRAARAYALQGNRTACADLLVEARNRCDRLPEESPSRFATESRAFTSSKITEFAAYCYIRLADYRAAERAARDALAVEAWSPGAADIVRVELGIALAHLGSPDEAAEHGLQALSNPRFLGGVLARARELDIVLMNRYPTTPGTQDFHEQYQLMASRALTN